MSHHIPENDGLDLDHKISQNQRPQSMASSSCMNIEDFLTSIDPALYPIVENENAASSPPHIASPSTSPLRLDISSEMESTPQFKSRWADPSTPTSPSFRYPDLSVPQSQPLQKREPSQDAATALHLRPCAPVIYQDNRAAFESVEENGHHGQKLADRDSYGFQNPRAEDEDFYDSYNSSIAGSKASLGSPIECSSVPLYEKRRPAVQTSPAPEGCTCGAHWHSSPSPPEALTSRFLSDHNTPRKVLPTQSLPAELENYALPAEAYVPLRGRSANSSVNSSGLWSGATSSALHPLRAVPTNSPHTNLAVANSFETRTPANGRSIQDSHSQIPQTHAQDDQSYAGPPGVSDEWSHFHTPIIEDEDVSVINRYGPVPPGGRKVSGSDVFTALPHSRSSGWLEDKLDKAKDASSSPIHANIMNIDDVKGCPAAYPGQDMDPVHHTTFMTSFREVSHFDHQSSEEAAATDEYGDLELEYWMKKHQEMLDDLRRIDTQQTRYGAYAPLVGPRTDVRIRMGRIREAESMLEIMHRKGFMPTRSWQAEYSNVVRLAERGNTYPLLAFVIAEFGEFFSLICAEREPRFEYSGDSTNDQVLGFEATGMPRQDPYETADFGRPIHSCDQDEAPASENPRQNQVLSFDEFCEDQEQHDLTTATTMGVIDGCQAVMGLMAIVGSRPSDAWQRRFGVLATNAHERGEVEPLVEFVREEAESVSKRNAAERAATLEARQNYDFTELDNLTETSFNSNSEAESDSEKGSKANKHKLFQAQASGEYAKWLTKNYPRVAESSTNRVVYIANSLHPEFAKNRVFETKQPFVVALGHYFDDLGTFVVVSILALAVIITLSEEQDGATYAEIQLRDVGYNERFGNPLRVQGFGVRGKPFDLDEEAIVAKIADLRKQQSMRKGRQPMRSELDEKQSTGVDEYHASSSTSGITLRRHASDVAQSKVGSSDLHLTTKEVRALHSNVLSEKGLTIVPLEEFPSIPTDPYNFVHYQLQIGQPPSTVFVNCERCHKILASFENVTEGPTVARRAEGELGDTYIVSAISSLNNIIDSVDKVKEVWVQVGTEKYFMRANEDGSPRIHECFSVEERIRSDMLQDQAQNYQHFAGWEDGTSEYDRLVDIPPHDQPDVQAHLPPLEPAEYPPPPTRTIAMPASQQFIPLHPNFPTVEMNAYAPCTVIAVCERRGIIHGVYQGATSYRAVFRGPGEAGETVFLDIRDPFGAFIGRLSRVRYYEVVVINGQVASFTAEDEVVDAVGLQNHSVSHLHGMDPHGMGLRGGALSSADLETESGSDWEDDDELRFRGGGIEGLTKGNDAYNGLAEEWASTGAAAEAPKNQHASGSASHSNGKPEQRDIIAASPYTIEPANSQVSSKPPHNDSDRISSWLQATSSIGPAIDSSAVPVFSEEYRSWLHGMHTCPPDERCALINPAPAPSFQDFWKDREAGRPATKADGTVWGPQPEEAAYDADIEEGEYIRLQSDSDGEAQAETQHHKDVSRYTRDSPKKSVKPGATAVDASISGTQAPKAKPYIEQTIAPNPKLVRILNKFLHEQAVKKAREAYNTAVRED